MNKNLDELIRILGVYDAIEKNEPVAARRIVDMSFASLNEAIIDELDLENVNFSHANMRSISMHKCRLFYTSFIGADLYLARLYEINYDTDLLATANFSYARMMKSQFQGSQLARSNFKNTFCEEMKASGSNFEASAFVKTNLKSAQLEACDLSFCQFINCNLTQTSFHSSTLITPNSLIAVSPGQIFLIAQCVIQSSKKSTIDHAMLGNGIPA
jgi:uncharacterized protein YjbI with pentapeptide repeats